MSDCGFLIADCRLKKLSEEEVAQSFLLLETLRPVLVEEPQSLQAKTLRLASALESWPSPLE
jgi:hypothetical protein